MSSNRTVRTIRRLLVANRGEIARRVMRSAHSMGIDTVAVFADGDADAPFVREAGRSVSLGGRAPAETYLDVAKVLEAAAATGCDAVHPGYGFLAENADFARAVEAAGMVWVGPGADAIASMGDKLAAKEMMIGAGVPCLPQVVLGDGVDVAAEADAIGFPVLVKASAGGGGKGMRIVESADELDEAVLGAQREAESSFGDPTVFVEKYLAAPRHIEIQVLADQHGHTVHLFERECSIQRRHQKIIEEAPSPVLSEAVRERMGAAAVAAARAVGYHSAGTVEFLLAGDGDDAEFFFLEMNTRIQVEHPVTEEITGVDLVREQLRIAMGKPLGFDQSGLEIDGHSIEARLYAEDPANDFLPATGTLHAFEAPAGLDVRIDTGVESGSQIGVEFDPMIAKVIVHAPTRAEAANRLALALERMVVAGLTTNRDFLVATLRDDAFLAGDTTTDFIERIQPPRSATVSDGLLASAAMAITLVVQAQNRAGAAALGFVNSGWRNSSMPPERLQLAHGDTDFSVRYRPNAIGSRAFEMWIEPGLTESGARADEATRSGNADGPGAADGAVIVELIGLQDNGASWAATIQTANIRQTWTVVRIRRSAGSALADGWIAHSGAGAVELTDVDRFPDHSIVDVAGGQAAPMPGKIMAVHVGVGDSVEAGQALVVMEAMKMEHTITALGPGTIQEVRCVVGDQVDNGQVLVVMAEADS